MVMLKIGPTLNRLATQGRLEVAANVISPLSLFDAQKPLPPPAAALAEETRIEDLATRRSPSPHARETPEGSRDSRPRDPVMGGCSAPHWKTWQAAGTEDWTVTVLCLGYRLPFSPRPPALSKAPLFLQAYQPGAEGHPFLTKEVASMGEKGAVEGVESPSPGYYSRLFLVPKASGGWRPIIDLSPRNKFLLLTVFKMETVASVITSTH